RGPGRAAAEAAPVLGAAPRPGPALAAGRSGDQLLRDDRDGTAGLGVPARARFLSRARPGRVDGVRRRRAGGDSPAPERSAGRALSAGRPRNGRAGPLRLRVPWLVSP